MFQTKTKKEMRNTQEQLAPIDWQSITEEMNERGYAIVSKLLTDENCDELIDNYGNPTIYRKTVVMERYRFGLGEYKYFAYPLPSLIEAIRHTIYPHLAPIANTWMKMLNIDKQFPRSFQELQTLCHANNQTKPTALILKYGKGGHNTLHQDLYGEIFFPMQLVLFLNEPDKDYTGGEFVLTQQTPRAQSKAIVLKPKKGDMLIFTTNFRPIRGANGYYRVNMKHGVSQLHDGERHTLGIIFHDALT
jgi:uncharacterized protein